MRTTQKAGRLSGQFPNLILAPSGQVFVEILLWISLIAFLTLGFSAAYQREYRLYRSLFDQAGK